MGVAKTTRKFGQVRLLPHSLIWHCLVSRRRLIEGLKLTSNTGQAYHWSARCAVEEEPGEGRGGE